MDIQPGTIKCLLDDQLFAAETGYQLRGYSVQNKGGDWQVIFRGRSRTGENVYCLFVAVELSDALQGLFSSVTGRKGSQYWYPDKYAK
jgi:hypothetical protein